MNTTDPRAYRDWVVATYNYKPVPRNVYDTALTLYTANLNGFTVDPKKSTKPISVHGEILAESYNRIITSAYGPYMEITSEQLSKEIELSIPSDQLWRTDTEWCKRKQVYPKYIHYTFNGVMVYFQLRTVSYAKYEPSRYYVSPWDLD